MTAIPARKTTAGQTDISRHLRFPCHMYNCCSAYWKRYDNDTIAFNSYQICNSDKCQPDTFCCSRGVSVTTSVTEWYSCSSSIHQYVPESCFIADETKSRRTASSVHAYPILLSPRGITVAFWARMSSIRSDKDVTGRNHRTFGHRWSSLEQSTTTVEPTSAMMGPAGLIVSFPSTTALTANELSQKQKCCKANKQSTNTKLWGACEC